MAKNTTKTSKKAKASASTTVEVKNYKDILSGFNNFIAKNIHDRYNVTFSQVTKLKLVAYGPWLAIVTLLVILPQLLVLANNGQVSSPVGFLEQTLFNRESWVLLIILLTNIILLVDGLAELFNKALKGWNRVYLALLVNGGYILYQLFTQLDQPAAPLLSLLGIGFCLFTVLDIKRYYK